MGPSSQKTQRKDKVATVEDLGEANCVSRTSDGFASDFIAVVYTLSVGLSGIVLPLYAAQAGYGIGVIGLMYAFSTAAQIAVRLVLGLALGHVSDRFLLGAGCCLQMASFVLVLASAWWPLLTASWALQGISRSCFWTGIETHVVRSGVVPAISLGRLHVFGSVGQLLGPLTAGFVLAWGYSTALLIGAGIAAVSSIPVFALERNPVLMASNDSRARNILKRRGMRVGCGAASLAGAWRGLMDSIVPVILQNAGHVPHIIGAFVTASNVLTAIGSGVAGLGREVRAQLRLVYLCGLMVTVGVGGIGLTASSPVAVLVVLIIGGLGSGVLQTLGPLISATSVPAGDSGHAIALQGAFRTTSMFAMPLFFSGLIAVVPVGGAFVGLAVVLACVTHRLRDPDLGLE